MVTRADMPEAHTLIILNRFDFLLCHGPGAWTLVMLNQSMV